MCILLQYHWSGATKLSYKYVYVKIEKDRTVKKGNNQIHRYIVLPARQRLS